MEPHAQVRPAHWVALMHELGPAFAERAVQCDASDAYVAANISELKERGVFAAGVPAELGGAGATYPELCEMLRVLARCCGSTALTLSMHMHPLATLVWRWRRDPGPVESFVRRVADERLQLVTSGASDWLDSSGVAAPVADGWHISGRKTFASGSPTGDLLMTTEIDAASEPAPVVLHFALPLRAQGVTVQENWRTLGMRSTGSHDVVIEDAFVPEAAISVRRPAGKWVTALHLAQMIALPLVFGCYVGVAEAMRDRVVAMAAKRGDRSGVCDMVGEMELDLASARIAHRDMVEAALTLEPSPETANRIFIGRTLVGRSVLRVADIAMEALGGSAFYRAAGVERLFRDIQGARYHRPQARMQRDYSGRLALGQDVDG
jgi:alkylation response protein AidB-like acyl-CoA dehydrogenase